MSAESSGEVQANIAALDYVIRADLGMELRAEGLLPEGAPVPSVGTAVNGSDNANER